MPSTPPVLPLSKILASHGPGELYLHQQHTPGRDEAGPSMPAGLIAISLAGHQPDEHAGGDAVAVRPTRVASRRTLDSAAYGQVRFNLDFVALSGSHGRQAHHALRAILGRDDPKPSHFEAIWETTRWIAERSAMATRVPGGEGAGKAWTAILQQLGYDIVLDRGHGLLSGEGTSALFLREGAMEIVATLGPPEAAGPSMR